MLIRKSNLRTLTVPYTFLPVRNLIPYHRPLQVDDLPALTAERPIITTDDEQVLMKMIQVALEFKANLTVVRITDSQDVLHYCAEKPASLVISDIMKPGIDGLELLRRLRENPQLCDLPFMFLTARCDSRSRGFALGAQGYLTKPVRFQDVIGEVQRLLLENYCKVPLN